LKSTLEQLYSKHTPFNLNVRASPMSVSKKWQNQWTIYDYFTTGY